MAEKYVNQPAIIHGLKQLPNSNLTIAKTGYTKPEDEIILRSKKEKADHFLNETIDFLEHNELAKPETKSFLETNKVLIPLLGSLLLVGLPTFSGGTIMFLNRIQKQRDNARLICSMSKLKP